MIKLIHTDREYLLVLPYAERLRAKRIPNYSWDSKEKLWRYPKNPTSMNAIMAEFGPDEVVVEWCYEDPLLEAAAVERCEALDREVELRNREIELIDRQMELDTHLSESLKIHLELWSAAEEYGFPEDGDLEKLVFFTKAAYEGNYKHADLAVQLATTQAKLDAANRSIAEMQRHTSNAGEDNFRQALLTEAWGDSLLPQVVRDFTFDSRGAIELQNYLSRALMKGLNKGAERAAFADLIREAQDAGILSDSTARVCHTLRIQRNFFAHERVEPRDVVPRAALCLYSFIIVYREIVGGEGAL